MLEYVFLREQLYFLLMNRQVDLLFVFLLSSFPSLGDRTINIKNKYYKKFISTKHDFYFAKFKLYRNRLQFLIKLSKNLTTMTTLTSIRLIRRNCGVGLNKL